MKYINVIILQATVKSKVLVFVIVDVEWNIQSSRITKMPLAWLQNLSIV